MGHSGHCHIRAVCSAWYVPTDKKAEPREEDFRLTRGEREMLLADHSERTSRTEHTDRVDRMDRKKTREQEEVLDAVLQEYFS